MDGERNGDKFLAHMDRLKPGKTYYVRAFAENSAGLQYGSVRRIKMQVGYAIPFDGVSAGGNWYTSDWFGSFMLTEFKWLYHQNLGWLYHGPVKTEGIWFWSESLGWVWTRSDVWPHAWMNEQGGWIYYYGQSQNGPIFWDHQLGDLLRIK